MTELDGLFSLRTPRDLLAKLEHDLERLRSATPTSREAQYAAFDFFVCAEHLADWVNHATGGSRKKLRSYPDGALVSHIANGAKHFRVDATRHTAAKAATVARGAFQANAFQNNAFQTTGQLVIELEDGTAVSAIALADRVLAHWKKAIA